MKSRVNSIRIAAVTLLLTSVHIGVAQAGAPSVALLQQATAQHQFMARQQEATATAQQELMARQQEATATAQHQFMARQQEATATAQQELVLREQEAAAQQAAQTGN